MGYVPIFRSTAFASLVTLLALCLVWELWLAPLRPEDRCSRSKAAPLALPLAGIYAGRRYTYQWSSLLVLAYFAEGVVRAWSESGSRRRSQPPRSRSASIVFRRWWRTRD
jgi:uncharacterized membrane protein